MSSNDLMLLSTFTLTIFYSHKRQNEANHWHINFNLHPVVFALHRFPTKIKSNRSYTHLIVKWTFFSFDMIFSTLADTWVIRFTERNRFDNIFN